MKNYYELSAKDKEKYRSEFNKLEFVKKINETRYPALIISIVFLMISTVFIGLLAVGVDVSGILELFEIFMFIFLALFAVTEIYLDLAFKRWMKIKHKVEY